MDVRIEKTKKKLRDALKKLSRVQPIDQISVSRLCQEASINRTTFYKYYAVPSDIEKELIDEALEEIAKTMHREEGTDIAVTIRLGLRLMIQEIGKEGVEYVSASVMEKFISSLWNPDVFRDGRMLYFIAGGTSAVVRHWLECPEIPEEQLAEELAEFIRALLSAKETADKE